MGYSHTNGNVGKARVGTSSARYTNGGKGNVKRRWWKIASAWLAGIALVSTPVFVAPVAAAQEPADPSQSSGESGASSIAAGAHDQANARAGKDTIAIAFQENWDSVARECTQTYGPEGIGYVEVSPPNETIKGKQWWTSYQPVSYKLDSKEGTEQQFTHMLNVCKAAGVGVIADVTFNDMAASSNGRTVTGIAGSTYKTDNFADGSSTHEENFPAVPYTSADFHDCTRNISNYRDANEVRNCRVTGLRDLKTESDAVQEKIATYLQKLWNLGVAGYRVDAAKHMEPNDLYAIKSKLATKISVSMNQIPWTQEVVDNGGEADELQPRHYYRTGRVTEFSYGYQLHNAFVGDVANLKNLAVNPDSHTSVDSAHADAFVTNWDQERGESTLTTRDGRRYEMANAFMLADNYGQPRIYSGYEFKYPDNKDDGAPGATETSVPDTHCTTASNKTGWTCLQRWTSIRGMIGFHNAVGSSPVADWQDPAQGVIAFNRGDKGTFALNNNSTAATVTLTTQLPDGEYCNVYASGDCSKKVTVANHQAHVTIEPQTAVAFYRGAEAGSWTGTAASDPSDPDYPVAIPANGQSDPITTVYFKLPSSWTIAYIHYGVNGQWTTAPGQRMTPVANNNGWVRADVNNQHAQQIEAVFTDGNNHWVHVGTTQNNFVLSGPVVMVENGEAKAGNPCPPDYQPNTLLTVHYKPQNASDQRGIYVWGTKKDGGTLAGEHHAFTGTDAWGKVVTLHLPGAYETNKLHFIVTTPDWNKFGGDRDLDASSGSATVWVDGTKAEDATQTPTAIPSSVARDRHKLTVRVHYHRADGQYKDWDVWHWNSSENGSAAKFTSHDDFGEISEYTETSPDGVQGSSIILRKGNWELKTADLTIPDNAIRPGTHAGEYIAEVWVDEQTGSITRNPILYTGDGSVINMGKQVQSASMETARTISVKLSKAIDDTALADPNTVKLTGATIASVARDTHDATKLIITTTDDIDPSTALKVSVAGYSSNVPVTMGAYVRSAAFDAKYDYDGKLGPQYTHSSTQFRLWAPTAQSVKLNTYASDQTATAARAHQYAMTHGTQPGKLGLWTVTVPGDVKNTAYDFTLTFAGGKTTQSPDPYATAATVNGDRSVVLSPEQTSISDFSRMPTFEGGPTNAIIGETDIRDLTYSPTSGVTESKRGTYLGTIEKGTKNAAGLPTGLDYLKKSGITHVQFQPMFQFASIDETKPRTDHQYNWGYDPKNYNVPEGWYSSNAFDPATRIIEMKKMIKGLHQAGLRVNMDVVYNHVYDASKQALGLTVPGYYFRYDANGGLTNGSGCGNDVASERGMARKYIVDSVTYWAKNYNLDGFRFDLMGLIDQTTMNRVHAALAAIDPGILIYGEGWSMAQGIDPDLVSDQQHANRVPSASFFNDAIRDDVKGSVFGNSDTGFVSGKPGKEGVIARDLRACLSDQSHTGDACRGSGQNHYVTPGQLLQYVEAHDNRTLYDVLAMGMFGDGSANMPTLTAEQDARVMSAVRHANAIVALAQGMPFIQIGQSFGRTKNGNANSYDTTAGDAVNDINWDLETKNKETEEYTEALFTLRKKIPAFRFSTYAQIERNVSVVKAADGVVILKLTDPTTSTEYYAIFNAGTNSVTTLPQIPAGEYSELIHGNVASTIEPLTVDNTGHASANQTFAQAQSASLLVKKGNEPTASYSTITLDAQGAQLPAGVRQSLRVLNGMSYTLPQLTREGYTFRGWKMRAADGSWKTVSSITPSASGSSASDTIRVYAQWQSNSTPVMPDHPTTPDTSDTPDHPSEDPLAGCPVTPFIDAKVGWYADAIRYVNCKSVMTGYSDGSDRFGPTDPLKRIDAATLLWREAGKPRSTHVTHYKDQKQIRDYATMAVNWAAEKHIMNGYGTSNVFGARGYLTRQEAAKIMAVAAGVKVSEPSAADLAAYNRLGRASSTHKDLLRYMVWAYKNGIITGWKNASGSDADPWGRVSRAQMAQIMANAMQKGILRRRTDLQ